MTRKNFLDKIDDRYLANILRKEGVKIKVSGGFLKRPQKGCRTQPLRISQESPAIQVRGCQLTKMSELKLQPSLRVRGAISGDGRISNSNRLFSSGKEIVA